MGSFHRFCGVLSLGVVAGLGSVMSVAAAKGPQAKTAVARATETRDRSRGGDSKRDDDDARAHGPAASVGAPNKGQLEGGVRLRKSPHLAVREDAHPWGHPALVKVLRHVASQVGAKHKGSVLLIADMSAKEGGPLYGHRSHQSGRDADVGFYVVNAKGKPTHSRKFVAFGADGRGRGVEDAYFDDARNWALVEALATTSGVRYAIVAPTLRARLLKYAASKHVSEAMTTRVAGLLIPPDEHSDVHDDHFHVRIACPASSHHCIEESIGQPGSGSDDIYDDAR